MTFPTLVSQTVYTTGGGTTWTPFSNLACTPGDLFVFFCMRQQWAWGAVPSGWTEAFKVTSGGLFTHNAVYRFATSTSESLTFTQGTFSYPSQGVLMRITGAASVTGAVSGSGFTTGDPPVISKGVADDYLWLVTRAAGTAQTPTAPPSGYGEMLTSVQGSCSFATAYRPLNAASENPGLWNAQNVQCVAGTICVTPAATPPPPPPFRERKRHCYWL